MYRILHQTLLVNVRKLKIKYIPSPEFALPDAEETCLGEDGLFTYPPELAPDMSPPPSVLPRYLAELYTSPLLKRKR